MSVPAEALPRMDGLDAQNFRADQSPFLRVVPKSGEISSPVEEAMNEWLKPSERITNPTHLNLINTEIWLGEFSKVAGHPVTLGTVPESAWDDLAKTTDGIWLMGVFAQSEASREISLRYAYQQKEAYPDLDPERDMRASVFAIKEHSPDPRIADGWSEFDKSVEQAHEHGMKVFVDFVPNHVGMDHPWTKEHPDWFIRGTEEDYKYDADGYFKVVDVNGQEQYIAHGRDPYVYPWIDTAQLNYANPKLQEAMKSILAELANHGIDGVRCDMAHLVLPDNFASLWWNKLSNQERAYITERDPESDKPVHDFWKVAISEIKGQVKMRAWEKAMAEGKSGEEVDAAVNDANFYFVAEAYRDKSQLDSTTRESNDGFDFIYGKDFYDNLLKVKNGELSPNDLRNHLIWIMEGRQKGGKNYQDVLFVENHDEERAVQTFGLEASRAGALLELFTDDSLFLLNQGQKEGRWIKPAVQMRRYPTQEKPNQELPEFYDRNLKLRKGKIFQEGNARLVGLTQDNPNIFAVRYESPSVSDGEQANKLVAIPVINYGDHFASCLIPEIGWDAEVKVVDLITGKEVENIDMNRDGGFYVGLPEWGAQMVYYTPKAA